LKTSSGKAASLEHILVSAFTGVLASTTVLLAVGRFGAERLFGHWLDERLQRQKEAHEIELAKLKSELDRQIERLRVDIDYLQDRGKHSNQREYDALAEIWGKFTVFHRATNDSIRGLLLNVVPAPNLEQMDDDGLTKFLDRNDFTEDERAIVREAANKNDAFSLVINSRSDARTRKAYWEFWTWFEKQTVFIPKYLADSFSEAANECKRAIVLRHAGERERTPADRTKDQDFLILSPGRLEKLEDAVRKRLHRDESAAGPDC
jgi:hypothetical protein